MIEENSRHANGMRNGNDRAPATRGSARFPIDGNDSWEWGTLFHPLDSSGKTIEDYLNMLLRKKKLVITTFLTVFALWALYTFMLTPFYRSVAIIEIKEPKQMAVDRLGPQRETNTNLETYMSTQIGILRSRDLVASLAHHLNIEESEEFSPQKSSLLETAADVVSRNVVSPLRQFLFAGDISLHPDFEREQAESDLINSIRDRVSVTWLKNSNLLEVGLDAKDPRFAKLMLQNYLDLYLARNLHKRRQESVQAVNWLKTELSQAERNLVEAEMALIDFASREGIFSPEDGGLAQVMATITKRMESLIKAQESRNMFQALDGQGSVQRANIASPAVSDQMVKRLKEELAVLEAKDAEMNVLYSENYPVRVMLTRKIEFLRSRIGDLERGAVKSALSASQEEEMLRKESYERAKDEARRIVQHGAQYALLKKNVESNRELHKIILKAFKEMDIKARTVHNNISIVDLPNLPLKPTGWSKGRFLAAGFVLASIAVLVLGIILDFSDKNLYTTELVERKFQVPSLGVVPDIPTVEDAEKIRTAHMDYEFLAYEQPDSPVSHAIRNIQASILFSSPLGEVRSMVVSSATAQQGKTFIAVSISTVLASKKSRRVLLVDADLRQPRAHRVFQHERNSPGLTTILTADDVEIDTVINADTIPGLFYMTSGPPISEPVSLFLAERFSRIMDELRNRFDFVVIDAPPILPFPDTQILSRNTDGVILVARQGKVTRNEFMAAAGVIASTEGARILGVILNQAPSRTRAYGYRGYYSYST